MNTKGPQNRIKKKLIEVRSLNDLEKKRVGGFIAKTEKELENISFYLTYLSLLERSRPRYFSRFRGGKAYSLLIDQVKKLILDNDFSVDTNKKIILTLSGVLPNPSTQGLTEASKFITTVYQTSSPMPRPPKPSQPPRLNTPSAPPNRPPKPFLPLEHLEEEQTHKPAEKGADNSKKETDKKPGPPRY